MGIEKLPLDLIYYGRLGKVRGIKGGLKIYPEEKYTDHINEVDYIFVKILGNPVPLKVNRYEFKGESLIFLEGIHSPDLAKDYAGLDIFLNAKEYPHLDWSILRESDQELEMLIGYSIIDEHSGKDGIIEEVVYNEFQSLFIVNLGNHKSYVPLADDFIVDIIHDEQKIILNLPEGILENKI